jgi:hypothetical protein
MSWVTVRTGVKTRLDTITGLSGHSRAALKRTDSAEASVVPSDPMIIPSGHRSQTEVRFTVRVTVVKGSLEDAQTALDAYIWPTGTDSIIAALRGDTTLSGAVDDVQFLDVTAYEQLAESNSVRADINFRAIVTA